MNTREKRRFFIIYTIIFSIVALGVYGFHLNAGTTFVKRTDGYVQHLNALAYYGKWLRQIIRTFLNEFRLVIPHWDFSIGLGADVFTTLHYYVIGDPLGLLSVIVPSRYTVYLYGFLVILRNYLAGIAFSCFCIYMGKKNKAAILAGTFTYIFCMYSLMAGAKHPFFLNPMIWFPLVLLGVEKILKKESPLCFIAAVFVSAVTNFYFFYMIAILTAIYVIVREDFLVRERGIKEVGVEIGNITLFFVIGLAMSAVIMLPVLKSILGDARMSLDYSVMPLYDPLFYECFRQGFVTPILIPSWTSMGYGLAAMFAVVLLFISGWRDKKWGVLRVLFLIGTGMLCFPVVGHIMNGFSYETNRWIWAYGMLVSYIIVTVWDNLNRLKTREILVLAILTGAYLFGCDKFREVQASAILVMLIVISAMNTHREKNVRKLCSGIMLLSVFAGNILSACYVYQSTEGPRVANSFVTKERIDEARVPDILMAEVEEENSGFYRYTGLDLGMNVSMLYGTRGTMFYWSMSNPNIRDYFEKTGLCSSYTFNYEGMDDRMMSNALAAARYFVVPSAEKEQYVPYKYEKRLEKYGYDVYEQANTWPLGYTYDTYVTEEQLDPLNGVEKEEAMMKNAVLEKEMEGYEKAELQLTGTKLKYEVAELEDAQFEDGKIRAEKKGARVVLKVEGMERAETYVGFRDLHGEGNTGHGKVSVKGTAEGVGTRKDAITAMESYSRRGRESSDFMLNLGYHDQPVEQIELKFGEKGTYTFDELYIWGQPLETYEEASEERQESALRNEVIGNDHITGEIDLDKKKILCLSIPYSEGWRVSVDDEEQELLKVNYMYCGVEVPAGEHQIVMQYHTPGMKAGSVISLGGLAGFLFAAYWERKKKKRVRE